MKVNIILIRMNKQKNIKLLKYKIIYKIKNKTFMIQLQMLLNYKHNRKLTNKFHRNNKQIVQNQVYLNKQKNNHLKN